MTTENANRTLTVVIVTPIAPELVEPIRAVADGVEVRYEPDLLPPSATPAIIKASRGSLAIPTRSAAGKNCLRALKCSSVFPVTRPRGWLRWCGATRGCAGCRAPPPARGSRSRRPG